MGFFRVGVGNLTKEQDNKHYTDFVQLAKKRRKEREKHKCGSCPYATWLKGDTLVFCSRFPCVKEK